MACKQSWPNRNESADVFDGDHAARKTNSHCWYRLSGHPASLGLVSSDELRFRLSLFGSKKRRPSVGDCGGLVAAVVGRDGLGKGTQSSCR